MQRGVPLSGMSGRAVLAMWLCAVGAVLFVIVTTLVGDLQGAPDLRWRLSAGGR